jgi:hypothetical protein
MRMEGQSESKFWIGVRTTKDNVPGTLPTGAAMKFRKLRIAWSVLCSIICVLLIGLWVRSYSIIDSAHVKLSDDYILCRTSSFRGCIYFCVDKARIPNDFPPRNLHQHVRSWFWPRWGWWAPTIQEYFNGQPMPKAEFPWFSYIGAKTFFSLKTPIWFWLIVCGAIAVASWIGQLSWHFRLRTLLIATTLFCLALGIIVWLAH